MSGPSLPTPSATDGPRGGARLRGRWLLLARSAWFAATGLTLCIFVASLLARLRAFDALYHSSLPAGWSEVALRAALAQLGLSTGFYIWYNLAFGYGLWLGCFVIATTIFWRKSDDRMTLFVSLLLITWPLNVITFGSLVDTQPAWRPPIDLVSTVGVVCFQLFLFLFPDGRFVPRWMRVPAAVFTAPIVLAFFLPGSFFDPLTWSDLVQFLVQLLLFGAIMLAQSYRYWRVSSLLQRQQTKWVVLGLLGSGIGIFCGALLPRVIFPWLKEPSVEGLLYHFFQIPLIVVCYLCVPISIGVAVLRYRLWDIDLLINRALVYGALTGTLALVYTISVVLLQAAVRSLTGAERSQLVTVGSTLLIAALFTPLRRRIQVAIDRRFYRRKYDAAKTLAIFGARVRDEVDLNALTGELLSVVEETMRPAHASLWLRDRG